jgi:hypothetical protein
MMRQGKERTQQDFDISFIFKAIHDIITLPQGHFTNETTRAGKYH